MLMVKDFWATPEYAELLDELNQRLYPYIVDGKGTGKEALDGVEADWTRTFNKYKRYSQK
jgi:multiple sugar transport system substrate-binding protein